MVIGEDGAVTSSWRMCARRQRLEDPMGFGDDSGAGGLAGDRTGVFRSLVPGLVAFACG